MLRIHNEFRSPAPRHIVGFYMRASHINRAGNVCNRAWLRDHNYDSVRGGPHSPQFILRSSQHNARSLDGIDFLYNLIYDDEYISIYTLINDNFCPCVGSSHEQVLFDWISLREGTALGKQWPEFQCLVNVAVQVVDVSTYVIYSRRYSFYMYYKQK